ncbi:MAG: peptide ABC transporter substrate-binding protein [Candidatus Eremiobacteraeota bacterium]|nr:peptide ABC transporter substrate-binding protein [Candidatus Eremiobacteraeota bacterium]
MKYRMSLVLLALLPGAVGAVEPPRVNASTQPHVFRYTEAEDIQGLNPVLNTQGPVNRIGQLAMAWLFRYDRENRPEPELATVVPTEKNGGISADGKTITYYIRKNVRWSDGQPFDADDVVFSFGVMNNPANNVSSREGFELITKIDEPNKTTVIVHLKKPFSPFIPTFFATGGGNPCLLPKHILGALANINEAPYNSLPVGVGPFRFTAWKRSDAVELEANPYYWRGLPKLKKIVYKIIPDRNTSLSQLQTGELDYWYPIPGAYLARAQTIRTIDLLRQPGYLYNHLDFNLTKPALQEKVVRQALRLAIDRKVLRDKVAHGVGFLQESVVPEPYPGVKKLASVPFDIAKANALLDAAGWKRAADGVRAKNGVRLSLEFASSSGSPDVDTQLEIIRGEWQQIGVEMTVKRYPSSMLFAPEQSGGIVYGGKFDVISIAWGVGALDDLYDGFACAAAPPNGQNDMHYCNKELDSILVDFQTRYDAARQASDLDKAAATIAEDVPTIVTSSREDIFGFNKDLKNFHPNNVTYFDDMMQVDI